MAVHVDTTVPGIICTVSIIGCLLSKSNDTPIEVVRRKLQTEIAYCGRKRRSGPSSTSVQTHKRAYVFRQLGYATTSLTFCL